MDPKSATGPQTAVQGLKSALGHNTGQIHDDDDDDDDVGDG